LRTRYGQLLKIFGGGLVVLAAAVIILPDLLRLLTWLGRIAILVGLIVAIAYIISLLINHIDKTGVSSNNNKKTASA